MSDNFEDRLRTGLHDLADSAPPPTIPAAVAGRSTVAPRHVALASIAAAIVLVAAALVFLPGGGRPRRVAVVAPTTTTTTGGTVGISPGSSLPPETTPAATSPATTLPATTSPAATSTSGVARTTATTPRTTVVTTPPTTVPPPCADLTTTTASDKALYAPGATVTITVTVRNSGAQVCRIATPYPMTFASTIKIASRASGKVVWAPVASAAGVLALPQPIDLAPGASYQWTTAQWDQHSCTNPCNRNGIGEGAVVPAGDYTAQPNDGLTPPSPATPATFTLQ